jgi:hypothetical protein
MPSCSNCQTPYEEGQRFCKTCGNSLKEATPKPIACLGCGVMLTSDQSFCHECGAVVDATPTPELPQLPASGQRPQGFFDRVIKGSPAHILALVGGCLLILIVIGLGVSWFMGRGGTPSRPGLIAQEKTPVKAKAQNPPGGLPTSGVLGPPYFSKPTDLAKLNPPTAKGGAITVSDQELSPKEEMEEVLFNLRKGQEAKDLTLYMSCFSPSYPNLDKKREDTLKSWQTFEFSQMLFNIEDIREVAPDSHIALVTWDIEARNLNNQKVTKSSQQYKVWFIKDAGKRLIKSLEKEGKEVKAVKND